MILMAEQQRGTPPGFTHSGGISTQAFDPFYNPSTGETWTASTGGFTPGPGWVRGTPPTGTESQYTSWVDPTIDPISTGPTIQSTGPTIQSTSSTGQSTDQIDVAATESLRRTGNTTDYIFRDASGSTYQSPTAQIRPDVASEGPIGSAYNEDRPGFTPEGWNIDPDTGIGVDPTPDSGDPIIDPIIDPRFTNSSRIVALYFLHCNY